MRSDRILAAMVLAAALLIGCEERTAPDTVPDTTPDTTTPPPTTPPPQPTAGEQAGEAARGAADAAAAATQRGGDVLSTPPTTRPAIP